MHTTHSVYVHGSQRMEEVPDGSVDLVVTSPPYPMISMWDELFSSMDPLIGDALNSGEGMRAFEMMHSELDKTWQELSRVVRDGGYLCVNIGDATRKLGDVFRLYTSHVSITDLITGKGFDALPGIVWHKPSNSPTKFMGSGMLPAGAYVTLEHEHILIFRKKGRREFQGNGEKEVRRSSSYFWEERNRWFTDVWNDLRGSRQNSGGKYSRERSAAFPLELPVRLIYMYSVLGDTVLDPFLGTGTTTQAAIVTGRNSIGYESEASLSDTIRERITESGKVSSEHVRKRMDAHMNFVREHRARGGQLKYYNDHIQCRVKEKSEQFIRPYIVSGITPVNEGQHFRVEYEEFTASERGGDIPDHRN